MAGSSPGPIADRAFDSGFKIAAVGGVVAVAVLYWSGTLSISEGTHLLYTLVFYPVYLVTAATVLGVWLGYETDATDLVKITREPETTDSQERRS